MKINRLLILAWVFMFSIITGSVLTSCDDDNENNDAILNSFGPSPALRGGELRFIGQNMNEVTAVILPENIEVTDFTMSSSEEIRIIIPQNAEPGFVTLKAASGDIITKTELSYSEPISIESYSPDQVKLGDTLTIAGDYLNLIKEVVFASNVSVLAEKFSSQSRSQIKVLVPAEAQTGKVAVSNGAESPIIVYTENVIDVVLPAITTVSPNPVKPGNQLTISGTDFDLVKAIVFSDELKVGEFSVDDSFTSITVTVPENVKKGKVKLIALSDVEVVSANDLTLVMPAIESISPNPIKNGETLIVAGTDLDLVTGVTFGGEKPGTIISASETELQITVPDDATTGEVRFATLSEEDVTGPGLTIIDPVFTSFTPAETKANTDVTIVGTDLDLVLDVVFVGDISGSISSQTETELVVTVPVGAKTGLITLIAKNGVQVVSPSEITILTNLPEFESFSEDQATPGQILTLNGTKMDLIKELVFPDNITATAYGVKTDTKVEVYVPEDAALGYAQIKMITYEGEEGLLPEIYIGGGTQPIENDAWVFFDFDASDAGIGWNDIGAVENDPAISISENYYRINETVDGGWKVYFARNWGKFSTEGMNAVDYAVKMDVNFLEPVGPDVVLKFRMTDSDGDFWYIWKVGELFPEGTNGWITTTLPLSGFLDNNGDGPGTITDVSLLGSEYGITSGWGAGKINMCVDNVRFGAK